MDYDQIRKNIIKAVFSDPMFMDLLTLKGGNALQYMHNIKQRSSLDIDLSMSAEFESDKLPLVQAKFEHAFKSVFSDDGYFVFDVKIEEQPHAIDPSLSDFWGGYKVSFKLLLENEVESFENNLEQMRRNAISISSNKDTTVFTLDISKYEYCEDRNEFDLDGYTVYGYSLPMMLFEKLRAVCQQTQEYRKNVIRSHRPRSRARDFLDIYHISQELGEKVVGDHIDLCKKIFLSKKVDASFLSFIDTEICRALHRESWTSVLDTTSSSDELKSFDFYFDYTMRLAQSVQRFWVK